MRAQWQFIKVVHFGYVWLGSQILDARIAFLYQDSRGAAVTSVRRCLISGLFQKSYHLLACIGPCS